MSFKGLLFSVVALVVVIGLLRHSSHSDSATATPTAHVYSVGTCLRSAAFYGVKRFSGSHPQWRADYPSPFFALFVDRLASAPAAAAFARQMTDSVRMTAGRYVLTGPATFAAGSTMSGRQMLEAKLAMGHVRDCLLDR